MGEAKDLIRLVKHITRQFLHRDKRGLQEGIPVFNLPIYYHWYGYMATWYCHSPLDKYFAARLHSSELYKRIVK